MKAHKFGTAINIFAGIMIAILLLAPSGVGLAQSPTPPDAATPFEGTLPSEDNVSKTSSMAISAMAIPLIGDVYQTGADRLTALQNTDGGWDWPLDDGNPASISPRNTVGPIGKGLAEAYLHTGDPDHKAALADAGALLLSKTNNFSPSDGYLAAALDDILGGTAYTDHVMTNFYGPLAAGTYNRNGAGTLYDTVGYVNLIRTSRSGSQANLAAWDLGMGLVGAASAGADTTAWISGVKAEIDELDGAQYYDVIGLAGAIYGLAFVGEDFDPTSGIHAAAADLEDLGDILVTYQLTSGGFTWNSFYVGAGNETNQETAYAILALDKLNRTAYLSNIQSAADYLGGVQLGTGGWDNYPGDPDGENNELTAEALWAVGAVYPLSEVWVCESGDCGHPEASFNSIPEAVIAVQSAGIVHVLEGTYGVDSPITVSKAVTLSGPTTGTAKVVGNGTDMFKVFVITSGDVTIQNLEITLATTPAYPLLIGNELESSLISVSGGTGMTGIVIRDNEIYVPAQTPPMTTWTARAITVGSNAVSGMSITGNKIYNTRNGVVIQYNNSATVSDNEIYNTKGGIMNYTNTQPDGDNRTMSGNSWGAVHNEWDIVWNTAYYVPDYQQSVLALSGANNDAYVADRRAADAAACAALTGNRSHVWVNAATGTLTAGPVNGNMNLPYATIQLGINAVVPGGTVYVAAGTYNEQIVISKPLTLTGEDGAVLDGTGLAPTWTTGVKIRSGNVTFNNIDVTNYTQDGITAYDNIDMPNLHITNSKISNIQPGYWGFGIYVGYESEGFGYTPPDLTTHLNFSGLLVEGNEITNVHSSALVLQAITGTPGTLLVQNNNIHDNTTNSGIWVDCARNLLIQDNTVNSNKWGVEFSCYAETGNTLNGPYGPKDIILQGNVIRDNAKQGVTLYEAWPDTFTVIENIIQGNESGIDNQLAEILIARKNWWGAASGPLDDKTLPGVPNYNNPSGEGNEVSSYVDYSPWCADEACTTFAEPEHILTVEVKDSQGNPVEGAVITYAVGSPNAGWQDFGTTGVDGTVIKADLTVGTTYHFYARYNQSTSLQQSVVFDGEDLVTFQTVPVSIKVETCPGVALEGAVVTYGNANSGFYPFGSTADDGLVSKELFPGNPRTFYARFNNTTSAHQTVIIVGQSDSLVAFKTTAVTLYNSGTIAHGSANGGWYPFTKPTMEMFAGSHTFLIGGSQVPIEVSGCSMSKAVNFLKLKDHNGQPLAGGTARGGFGSNFSTWHVAGATDANGLLVDLRDVTTAPASMSYEMKFNNTTQVKTQDVSTNSVFEFQTSLVNMRLQTCDGTGLANGAVRYGIGATYTTWWFPGGNTNAGGDTSAEFFSGTYSFEMQYQGTAQSKLNLNLPAASPVVWNTTRVMLQYAGQISYGGPNGQNAWFTKPSMNLLPGGPYKFHFQNPEGGLLDLSWSGCNYTASVAAVKLIDSTGAGIAGATAQYYDGGWKDIPGVTNANGLLPVAIPGLKGKVPFALTYGGVRVQKAQDISLDSIVTFQTAAVTMKLLDSTGAELAGGAEYYAKGWKTLGGGTTTATMELLPVKYAFKVTYGGVSLQKYQDVSVDPLVIFRTVPVTFKLLSSTDAELEGGAQYYADGWRNFGDGTTTEVAEMLPVKYTFLVTYAGKGLVKTQDVASNPVVIFKTKQVTMKLLNKARVEVAGAAEYYVDGWKTFGSGVTTTSMELLPSTYPFQVTYNGVILKKYQNIAVNPLVVFTGVK
ncbi:MAG: right-handed parallel beta-helix repeat-containing protein [Chloroflexi bacterium]|nr:right-handed parallel beta-helix repeat-containing protein [Chloroflexota bacterium]